MIKGVFSCFSGKNTGKTIKNTLIRTLEQQNRCSGVRFFVADSSTHQKNG
jgi:hypothetical protein